MHRDAWSARSTTRATNMCTCPAPSPSATPHPAAVVYNALSSVTYSLERTPALEAIAPLFKALERCALVDKGAGPREGQ